MFWKSTIQIVVITTSQRTNSNTSNKSQGGYQVWITRELDKESPIYSYTIYIKYSWFTPTINNPTLMSIYQPWVLWDALNMNNFYFLFLLFSDFIGIFVFFFFLFSFLDNKEVCDIKVTWLITWCDIIGLEGGRRIRKMTSGHMEYTWWPWGRHEDEAWTIGQA